MAEPFGTQDRSGASKRPAPTIEGTATEIAVEPGPESAPRSEPETEPAPEAETEAPRAAGAAEEPGQSEPPAGPRRRFAALKSFMTHCAAGLAGGLAGVTALALAWNGLWRAPESGPLPEIAALEQRIAKLEAAPPASAEGDAVAQLESRIAALEVNTRGTPAEIADLETRLSRLESTLKTMAETADEGGSLGSAAAVTQQLAEAERRLNEKIAAARAEGERLGAAVADLQSEIAALNSKLGALAEAELGGADAAGPALEALTERLDKVEALLPELVGAIGKETAETKSAAAAIAFANLRAAVTEGRPYAAELDTLGALVPGVGDLGVLPAYAEKGIPTLAELVRSFAAAREAALAAAAPPPGGSFLDNLLAGAQSLVTVKRIDEEPAGEGPPAALARAEAALDHGDLASAIKQIETLTGAPREAFADWLGGAHARLGADEILTRLEGQLLLTMSGDETQPPELP